MTKYYLGHFEFMTVADDSGKILTWINYRHDPRSLNEGPDWGASGKYKKDADASAISALETFQHHAANEFGLEQTKAFAEEIAAALYAVGLIDEYSPISWFGNEFSFVYKGRIYLLHGTEPFAEPLHGGDRIYNANAFRITDPAMATLFAINWSAARERAIDDLPF